MKPSILLCTTAAMAASFIHPLQARADRGSGRGGDGRAAPAQAAPRVGASMQAPRMQAGASTRSFQAQGRQSAAIAGNVQGTRSFQAQGRQNATIDRNVQGTRSFEGRQSPTIAFGGNVQRNTDRNMAIRNDQRLGRSQSFSRSDFRGSRVP